MSQTKPDPRRLRFVVDTWSALAAGLATQQDWLTWFRQPIPPEGELSTDVSWIPAALRRRVSPLGRAALSVLKACRPEGPCPVVFASRYGDLDGTAKLLTQLHQEGGVSPTGFSLAVHNAVVGMDSIARQDRMATTSLAATVDLPEAACFEALGWLADGAHQVLVVCCEDPVPPPYVPQGTLDFRHAWACRLRAVSTGGLSLAAGGEPVPGSPLPPSLRALSFLAGASGNALSSESGRYQWRRHA